MKPDQIKSIAYIISDILLHHCLSYKQIGEVLNLAMEDINDRPVPYRIIEEGKKDIWVKN